MGSGGGAVSDLPTIRAAIVARLLSIPDIGVVHDYERFARGEKEFRELYLSGGRILGWHVRRVATAEKSPVLGRWYTTHDWEIRGFMGLDDAGASETVFDGLIEAIRAAFRADESLGVVGLATVDPAVAGIQVTESGPVMFGGVLCHGARLALRTHTDA